jgi:hypothetical protein
MPVGHLLTLDHDLVHDVVAIGDSVLLLTIAWPADPLRTHKKLAERTVTGLNKLPTAGENTTADRANAKLRRELGLDETLAETFPCSDPISSDPNPLSPAFETRCL